MHTAATFCGVSRATLRRWLSQEADIRTALKKSGHGNSHRTHRRVKLTPTPGEFQQLEQVETVHSLYLNLIKIYQQGAIVRVMISSSQT